MPPDREALPDRRERAALALADRISVAMVRREDEPADVCRWHRDVVDLVLDAADFDRLEQAQTERDGFDEQCRGFAQAARETGTEMARLRAENETLKAECAAARAEQKRLREDSAPMRAENERLTHDRDAFERTAALQAEEADRAKAEVERMRKALSWIYSYAGGWSGVTGDDAGHLTAVGMHAKEALELPRPSDEESA